MIKAIIVDDEAKGRSALNTMLARHCPSIDIAAMTDSVSMAQSAIEKYEPELVFLDIEMPFENGFALLEKIKAPSFDVIFTTAYDHYAIKAIKFSALDYLLKPIDADDLVAAVSKIESRNVQKKQAPDFELLMANLRLKSNSAKISVPTFTGLQMLNAGDIIKCKADESYTQITMANGTTLVVSRLLREYEDLLSDLNFFRVHNSYLINLSHVVKYIKGDGGHVVMTDGETVDVSRRKKNELLSRLALLRI